MRSETKWLIALVMALVLAGILLLALGSDGAVAGDAVSVKRALRLERAAHRELARARTEYSEARAVARHTRTATAQYGKTVGRWIWLLGDVGWPRSTWGQLAFIINRESRGYPGVVNSSSGCTGLLQILPSNVSEPARLSDPRYNLEQGLRLYRLAGFSPWAL